MSKKRIIFSNMPDHSNCYDDCSGNGCDCDYMALDDERINLFKHLDGRIIAIADLGLWNGRRSGYKILDNTISSILYTNCEYAEWFGDGYNIRAKMIHHDGTDYILYRVLREDRNIDKFLDKIYNGDSITPSVLNYYTSSLYPHVAKIYGWSLRKRKSSSKKNK